MNTFKTNKIRVTAVDAFVRATGVVAFTVRDLAAHYGCPNAAASGMIQNHLAVQRGKTVQPYNGLSRSIGRTTNAVWLVGNNPIVINAAERQFKDDVARKASRNPKAVLHTIATNNPKMRPSVNEALLQIDVVLASL